MEGIIINGGRKLEGRINVHGSKNSSLPILAATVLIRGVCVLHNCPDLSDVRAAQRILEYLGCVVKRELSDLIVDASNIVRSDIPEKLMHEMRSSIVFLGSLLSRTGRAEMCAPGGCEIGLRPIDLHLTSLKLLGARINESRGKLFCGIKRPNRGGSITLSFPSVGATENIILFCAVSDGVTNIFNAAREPEIADLVNFLNSCGANIKIGSDGTITVIGVKKLHPCEHTVIPDRITAATYMAAVASCGGDVLVENTCADHMKAVLSAFEQTGCKLTSEKNSIRIKSDKRPEPIKNIRTMPYPGFPTDAQAPIMAVTSIAGGTSVIVENIFESRFKHVPQLMRMGANIRIEGRVAVIEGVERLYGANVEATDLRGGSALVVAALGAEGESLVTGTAHIDRGYERLEESLRSIGADIRRGYKDERKGKKKS